MNRHERRASAKKFPFARQEDCPCCNVRKVFLNALNHTDELRTVEDQPVIYPTSEGGETAIADFGILQITSNLAEVSFTVTTFGEEVFHMTPDGSDVVSPGPWIATLRAIREQLDARFGAVALGGEGTIH